MVMSTAAVASAFSTPAPDSGAAAENLPPPLPAALPAAADGAGPVGDEIFASITCTILSATKQVLPLGWRLPRQAVAHCRVFICLSGQATFIVGDQPHSISPGELMLVSPHVPLEGTDSSQSHKERFSAYIIDFTARLYGVLDLASFCVLPVTLRLSADRWPKVLYSAQNIIRHRPRSSPGGQLAVHAHCVRLLGLLWYDCMPGGVWVPPSGDGPARLLPALRLMEQHYRDHLTLHDLARTVHLHPVYFASLFKRVVGVPPLRYLTQLRLERARILLVGTSMPLRDVATLTGFYDAAHLIRIFRRSEGVSPGRFRHGPRAGIAS